MVREYGERAGRPRAVRRSVLGLLRRKAQGSARFATVRKIPGIVIASPREEGRMHLLVIRHAIAESRESFAKTEQDDDLRPLTAEGRYKMVQCAEGLRAVAPKISMLATSPLTRARETAEIVAEEYGIDIRAETDALRPRAVLGDFADWIAEHDHPVVAVVGHEPHLSTLVTWLLCGVEESHLELKKGGACLLAFKGAPKRGSGTLEWAVHPRLLRTLAKER
jgi:phosphohistidine phosphatase